MLYIFGWVQAYIFAFLGWSTRYLIVLVSIINQYANYPDTSQSIGRAEVPLALNIYCSNMCKCDANIWDTVPTELSNLAKQWTFCISTTWSLHCVNSHNLCCRTWLCYDNETVRSKQKVMIRRNWYVVYVYARVWNLVLRKTIQLKLRHRRGGKQYTTIMVFVWRVCVSEI